MQNRTSANIIGPDLNEYRGTVNYSLLATKTNYSYLRASGNGSGRFREDKKFVEYAQGLRSVGIKSGGYHYAVPSYDLTTADEQCDEFINVLQKAYGEGKYGDLFPVIDIEAPTDKSISTDALLNWVDRFRKRFERKTRRILMLYTGAFFIELYNNFYHSTKGFILSDMPLWIAMYPEIKPNPPYPIDQGGWTRWRMWQYTERGTISGVNPPVDLNYGPVNLDLLTQPRDVKNLNVTKNGRSIRLTWSPNTDVDLAGYNIFLNSNYVTTLGKNATSYTIQLGPQTAPTERYEVSIEAFDTDGDFSPNRSKATVTFTRNDEQERSMEEEAFIPVILEVQEEVKEEVKEVTKEIVEERKEKGETTKSLTYVDPVGNLERKFLGEIMDEVPKLRSRNRLENEREAYEDFVESNGEFDDNLYLNKLENEIVYKRYYGEIKNQSQLEFYDIHEDDDDDDVYPENYGERHEDKCSCKENNIQSMQYNYEDVDDSDETSDSKEDYNEDEDSNIIKFKCNKINKKVDLGIYNDYLNKEAKDEKQDVYINEVEKMKNKMNDYEILQQCDFKFTNEDNEGATDKDRLYKDIYEGERRRLENKDTFKKKNMCHNCTEDKEKCNDCEYMIYDMYLSNCDYGHKKHEDKKKNKYKEESYDKHHKKKKKKHH